jgi:hypothetical protein
MTASNQRISTPHWSWLARLALLGLVAALVLVAGVGHGRASAESSPQLTSMAVAVMPEYDQPRVLVSYRGDLNADASLPLEMRLRLPADATIERVCSIKQPEEEYICPSYEANPDGQYLAVTWEAVTPTMYVEFYYGSVSGAGERSLDFDFWPPYAVDNLDLFVLEPADATDFSLSPAPDDSVGEQDFRHHSYNFQDVPQDEPVTIEMTYARPTGEPLASPRTAATLDDGSGISQTTILTLGLAGVAVLAFVLYRVFARRFRVSFIPVSGRVPGDGEAAVQKGTFFCRQCGGTVQMGFQFCPGCGQEVRSPPKEQR